MKSQSESWVNCCVNVDSTIEDAIKILNHVSLRIVLVVNSHGVLLGTISDGDIRRALLKGYQFSNPILEVFNTNPTVVTEKIEKEQVMSMMLEKKVYQIPIIDSESRVIGLHLWDEVISKPSRVNQFVIMAGGRGSRLLPKTQDTPKPMLEIAGKPMLEHIISRAKSDGFLNFVIAVHYRSEVILDYFGDGRSFGVNIDYLKEDSPLGTGGALSLLNPIPDEPIMVSNGDVITDVKYGNIMDYHVANNASATMSVQLHTWQNPFGVVSTEGLSITKYEEKPVIKSLVNAGIYALNPEVLMLLNRNTPFDMPMLFQALIEKEMRTIAYPIHEIWMDLGDHASLNLANEITSK